MSAAGAAALRTQYLNQYLTRLLRLFVQLDHENALPLAQRKLSIDYRDAFARPKQEMLTVRMSVWTLVLVHVDCTHAKIVMAVVSVARSESLERVRQILKEQRLMFLNGDARGRVLGEDDDESVGDARFPDAVGDSLGDVDELRFGGSVELQHEGAGIEGSFPYFHAKTSCIKRGPRSSLP